MIRRKSDTRAFALAQDGYKVCPFCGEAIRREAIVCRYCGRPKKTEFKTYDKRKWGCLLFVGLVVLITLFNDWGGTRTTTIRPTSTARVVIAPTLAATATLEPTSTPEPTATVTPEWMAPPFEEICQRNSSMTDAQFREYLKTFIGKKFFDWDGSVDDVYEYAGNYRLDVSMEAFGSVKINDIGRELGMSLDKVQPIRFSGTIEEIESIFGDPCFPLRVKDAEIVLR